jgi:hypothetical protein
VRWLVPEGHTVASINRALSTFKAYSKLAAQAGGVSLETLALIRMIAGYGHREAKRIDEAHQTTRVGRKKAEATSFRQRWRWRSDASQRRNQRVAVLGQAAGWTRCNSVGKPTSGVGDGSDVCWRLRAGDYDRTWS